MPRVLIVYHTRTGHTARVAARLATALQADVEPLVESMRRARILDVFLGGFRALFRKAAPTAAPVFNPSDYDLVIVGTPGWDRSLPSPVGSYLRTQGSALPRIGFFCVGGVDADRVFEQMSKACGRAPVATMALTEAELATAAVPISVARFIVHIKAAQGPRRAWERRDLRDAGRTRLGA